MTNTLKQIVFITTTALGALFIASILFGCAQTKAELEKEELDRFHESQAAWELYYDPPTTEVVNEKTK